MRKIYLLLGIVALILVGRYVYVQIKVKPVNSVSFILSQDAAVSQVDKENCPSYQSKRSCNDQEIVTFTYAIQGNENKMQGSKVESTGKYKVGQKVSNLYYHPTLPGQFEIRD